MEFITEDHNNGLDIVKSNIELGILWHEIQDALTAITDDRIKSQIPKSKNKMSLSAAINDLIDEELTKRDWIAQSAIFQGAKYRGKRWRLDFSKRIEKPHKEITGMAGAGVGIYICATKALKKAGGFDGAVGEYEKVLRYLLPMAQKLTRPLIIIGLEPPKTFKIVKKKDPITKKNKGEIVEI
jgi:hypothetical protein